MFPLAALLLLAALLAACGGEQRADAPGRYRVIDLGVLPGRAASAAFAVNNRGQVAGFSYDQTGVQSLAWVWEAGALRPLALPEGSERSLAFALNDAGQVAGTVGEGPANALCLWTDGEPLPIGNLRGQHCAATGINAAGQLVGWAETPERRARALHFTEEEIRLLSVPDGYGSEATAINDRGQIVGLLRDLEDEELTRAVRWDEETLRYLDGLGGGISQALAINGEGTIAGEAVTEDGLFRACLWRGDEALDLGTLGGEHSVALGLNDRGQVVGAADTAQRTRVREQELPVRHAFLWEEGRMLDLNSLITRASGWELGEARGINNDGWIVGQGDYHGRHRAFLLQPR